MSFGAVLFLVLSLLLPAQSPRDSFKLHYERAEALRRKGDLSAAEAEYAAILSETYYKLGKILSAQANYPESVTALEAAAAYSPDSDQVLIDLAIGYFQIRKYDQALTALNNVISRDSQNPGALHMLGKTYFMLGDFERATTELQTALNSSPKDYDVAYTLGLAYLKRSEIASARRIFDLMVEQLGNKPQLRVLIGRAYRETGFLSEAIEEFKKALALDPRFPRVHYYLGLTTLLKGGIDKLDEAQEQFKIELANHPDEFFAHYYLGIAATVERNWTDAVSYLLKASQLQPGNPDPYFFMGQAFQGLNKHAQAIDAFKKSIELNPNVKHNDYQVGNAHYRLGQ
ncbi:MAG: tetratricopeptide repeat protein, partial [Pyrinomonadaceae bacterium]|nr:tetratricopeptide repeat protein [Pyrinomonadaceae bacterium]